MILKQDQAFAKGESGNGNKLETSNFAPRPFVNNPRGGGARGKSHMVLEEEEVVKRGATLIIGQPINKH